MFPLRISSEPLDIKYMLPRLSPRWSSMSPGAVWVVTNFMDNVRKQPWFTPRKAALLLRRLRFRCIEMSAWRKSGKSFMTCKWRLQKNEIFRISIYINNLISFGLILINSHHNVIDNNTFDLYIRVYPHQGRWNCRICCPAFGQCFVPQSVRLRVMPIKVYISRK